MWSGYTVEYYSDLNRKGARTCRQVGDPGTHAEGKKPGTKDKACVISFL